MNSSEFLSFFFYGNNQIESIFTSAMQLVIVTFEIHNCVVVCCLFANPVGFHWSQSMPCDMLDRCFQRNVVLSSYLSMFVLIIQYLLFYHHPRVAMFKMYERKEKKKKYRRENRVGSIEFSF